MFFNKKGVSEVVANVLIVLLVIVGVAVIWSVVKPTIDKSAEQIDTGCFEVSLEATSCKSNPAVTTTTATTKWDVVVKRSTGAGKLTGMKLIFEDAAGATQVIDAPTTPAISGLTELATIKYPSVEDGTTFVPTKLNVAAVVGDNLRLCTPLTTPINCA